MLNVLNEIEKYEKSIFEADNNDFLDNELSQMLQIFTQSYNRIAKEQYKSNNKIEEIMSLLEEESQIEQIMSDQRNNIKSKENEIKLLLKGLMDLADSIEDIYRISLKGEDSTLRKHMLLQWQNIGHILALCGMTRIEALDSKNFFDAKLHIVVKIKQSPDFLEGEIIETVKSGYIYKANIIRKAEVIINQFNKETDQDE